MERGGNPLEKFGRHLLHEVHSVPDVAKDEGLADILEAGEQNENPALSNIASRFLEIPNFTIGKKIEKRPSRLEKPKNTPLDQEELDWEFDKARTFLKAGWQNTNPRSDLFLKDGLALRGDGDIYILARTSVAKKGAHGFEFFYKYVPKNEASEPIKYPNLKEKKLKTATNYTIFQVDNGILKRIGSTNAQEEEPAEPFEIENEPPKLDPAQPLSPEAYQ